MQKIVLIAGYTKISYLQKIRLYFGDQNILLGCVYMREPKTEFKERYLAHFDLQYNLSHTDDVTRLKENAHSVVLITCTQERDMTAYIQSLQLCKKVTEVQANLYRKVINKYEFKQTVSNRHPELVPSVKVIDNHLLENLDTLSFPQVIKPSGLAGSIMVNIVNTPQEFHAHYKKFAPQMQKIAEEHYIKQIQIIAENYVEGPQYSVNTYISGTGDITFCPLVRVVTPQKFGINDTYNVFQHTTDEISPKERGALETAVTQIVQLFDIKNTSAHFDLVLCDGQWKFFEVGLRIGGNRQKLFEHSHGIDHFLNDIKNRLGLQITIPVQKKTACVVQKASETEGVLQSISYTRMIEKEKPSLVLEDKMAKIGEAVKPLSLGGGMITRHFVSGKDESDVLETSRSLFENISFTLI